MNIRRMIIALIAAAACGIFCAYGTSTVEILGFEVTLPYLLTIFYSRLLIGFVIGLTEHVTLCKNTVLNAATRGAIIGAILSIALSFYGGALIFITAGIIYGIITDILATKFST
ncbi:hypothetical protein [[Eubacterium] cellulosolvens]